MSPLLRWGVSAGYGSTAPLLPPDARRSTATSCSGLRLGPGGDVGRDVEHHLPVAADVAAEHLVSLLQHPLDLILGKRRAHQGQPTKDVGLHHRAESREPPHAVMGRYGDPRR